MSYKGFTITQKANNVPEVNIFDNDGYWVGQASSASLARKIIDDSKGE